VSEMVSREAVLAIVQPKLDRATRLMCEAENKHDRTLAESWEYEQKALALVLREIKALPADDRRCANCEYWHEWPSGDEGACWVDGVYWAQGASDIGTKPNHYCAAHRRKKIE